MHTSTNQHQPQTIRLADYKPYDYRIETVNLQFELGEEKTVVKSLMTVICNHDKCEGIHPLVLNGRGLKLLGVRLDDRELSERDYKIDDETLTIIPVPDRFLLEIDTEIDPAANTELSGLYRSGSMFCTQCEAEGFR